MASSFVYWFADELSTVATMKDRWNDVRGSETDLGRVRDHQTVPQAVLGGATVTTFCSSLVCRLSSS